MTATTEMESVIESAHEADEQPNPTWWQQRRWQALLGAFAVAGSAIGAAAWIRGDGPELPGSRPIALYGLDPMTPGKTDFSMGDFAILAPGKDVRVLSVKALTSSNVEQLGAYVIWPRDVDRNRLSFGPGFPYPDQPDRHDLTEVVPAAETSFVDPGDTEPEPVRITVGFRVLSGMGGVNGISVTYKVNGKTKREYLGVAAVACVKPLLCEENGEYIDTGKALRRLGLVRED